MSDKKTPTFEEYQKALTEGIVKGFGVGLRPYQRAAIEALTAPSGDGKTFKFPRYHTGGVVEPSKTKLRPILDFDHRIKVHPYRPRRPRTDDMIQMLADFERHEWPYKKSTVIINISIKDGVSKIIEGLSHDLERTMARIAAGRRGFE